MISLMNSTGINPFDPIESPGIESSTTPNYVEDIGNRSITELVEIIILSLCLAIGGPLNVISFYKLSRHFKRRSRSVSQINLLRIHLNIADLMTMFIYVTSQIVWMITFQWYGGDLLCRICKFFHTFVFYLNSFVIACIAIDRVFGAYNLGSLRAARKDYSRCKIMLCIAWLAAFVLSIPQSFIFRVVSPAGVEDFTQCSPVWTILYHEIGMQMISKNLTMTEFTHLNETFNLVLGWERAYGAAHLLFVFWIPTFIIAISYFMLIFMLNALSAPKKEDQYRDSFCSMFLPYANKYNIQFVEPERATITLASPTSSTNCLNLLGEQPSFLPNGPSSDRKLIPDRKISASSYTLTSTSTNSKLMPLIERDMHKSFYKAKSTSYMNYSPRLMPSIRLESLKNGTYSPGSDRSSCRVGPMAMQTIAKARQKAKRQAALILLAYLTFWTPYNILSVVNAFAEKDGWLKEIAHVTLPFLNSLIVVNPIVNPLIYGVFDRANY